MSLTVHFKSRDFSLPIFTGCECRPLELSWTAFGGPDRAALKLDGALNNLLACFSLLRCPVEIADQKSVPVWWGFVERVTLAYGGVKFELSLEDVYNRVRVLYSFLSPDNRLTARSETPIAQDVLSENEFGIREFVIHKDHIDEAFAENLRDTFLEVHAWPQRILSDHHGDENGCVTLACAGWFKTLSWQFFQSPNGFYANHGPGPGSFIFGSTSTALYPSQSLVAMGSSSLQYAYFMLRKFGNPTQDISVILSADAGGSVGASLASTSPLSAVNLNGDAFEWVRFTFPTPYPLVNGTKYWLIVDQNGVSVVNYFAIRIDENMGYAGNQGLYYNGSTWISFPAVTHPSGALDAFFRAVCTQDTGEQLSAIARAGNQFFAAIHAASTGVFTCPYRSGGRTCLKEIQELMQLGSAENRPILARVTPEKHLFFYEQPSPVTPTVYVDQQGHFLTDRGKHLSRFHPPVGQWMAYAGTDLISSPWDNRRVPLCFVSSAKLNCLTGNLKINSL
jgi:hypothetical protein